MKSREVYEHKDFVAVFFRMVFLYLQVFRASFFVVAF